MVDFFITPSIVQQFYLKPEWGIQAYYNTIEGVKTKGNYFTRKGVNLHNKYGYDNDRRYFKTKVLEIDGEKYVVALEGTPDHINPLRELKTFSVRRSSMEDLEKKIEAASIQLLGYMFLTDSEYGFVVFMDRHEEVELVEVMIPRNDDLFFEWVRKFFIYLWSIPTLKEFEGGE